MASLLQIFTLLVPLLFVSANEVDRLRLEFLDDYISWYNIHRITFVTDGPNEDTRRQHLTWFKSNPSYLQFAAAKTLQTLIDKTDAEFPGILLWSHEEDLEMFFKLYNSLRTASWIVFGKTSLRTNFASQYLTLDNMVVLVVRNETDTKSLELWEGYKASPDLPYHETQIGEWTDNFGLDLWETREPFSRRTNLTGLDLRVTTVDFTPFIITSDNADGTVSFTGTIAELFDVFISTLNCTATISRPKDLSWGALDPKTGLMNGMIGELVANRADIAVNALDVTYTRSLYVDYPTPLDSFGYYLVMESPGARADWTKYTIEFSNEAWMIILLTLVALMFFLHAITRINKREETCSPSDSFLFVTSAFCNMGISHEFRSTSARILLITIFITTIIVYTYYCSFLIAALAVERVKMPFEDLQGLYANREKYKLGIIAGSSLADFLRTSKENFLRSLWTDMIEPHPISLAKSNDFGLELIKQEPLVFLTYAPTYIPSEDITRLRDSYFSKPMSWPVQKRSPLLPILNYQFKKWHESGLYQRINSKIIPKPILEEVEGKELGYSEMFTAFAMFGTGLVVAMCAILLEISPLLLSKMLK